MPLVSLELLLIYTSSGSPDPASRLLLLLPPLRSATARRKLDSATRFRKQTSLLIYNVFLGRQGQPPQGSFLPEAIFEFQGSEREWYVFVLVYFLCCVLRHFLSCTTQRKCGSEKNRALEDGFVSFSIHAAIQSLSFEGFTPIFLQLSCFLGSRCLSFKSLLSAAQRAMSAAMSHTRHESGLYNLAERFMWIRQLLTCRRTRFVYPSPVSPVARGPQAPRRS